MKNQNPTKLKTKQNTKQANKRNPKTQTNKTKTAHILAVPEESKKFF